MRIMIKSLLLLILIATESPLSAEPIVTKYDIGDVVGLVTKIEPQSITVKVNKVVQTGVTRRHINGRNVAIPKYTTKQEEVTYQLSDAVNFRTNSGKSAKLGDIQNGDQVRLHVYKMSEHQKGEKLSQHMEVLRVDITNSTKKR